MEPGYRTPKDKNYYSSDLSKWIDENCTHEMTSINLDIFQLKRSCKKSRIIESKHSQEGMKYGQREALQHLANLFVRMKVKFIKVYIIYGDYPYEKARIVRLSDNKEASVNQEQLRKFLNFEYQELEDINCAD
jgi:hypothetical protein